MKDFRQLEPEQLTALTQLEAEVRARFAPHDAELHASIINARMSAGMGLNLENTCPYYRACAQKKETSCVGSESYRQRPCYRLNLIGENETSLAPIMPRRVGATD